MSTVINYNAFILELATANGIRRTGVITPEQVLRAADELVASSHKIRWLWSDRPTSHHSPRQQSTVVFMTKVAGGVIAQTMVHDRIRPWMLPQINPYPTEEEILASLDDALRATAKRPIDAGAVHALKTGFLRCSRAALEYLSEPEAAVVEDEVFTTELQLV